MTYSARFGPQGSASRAFTTTQAGSVVATLVEAGPPSSVVLGLGLGIPRADGSGCALAMSILTPAGPDAQVASTVDAGTYCVKVFAAAGLTDDVAVTVRLEHPWIRSSSGRSRNSARRTGLRCAAPAVHAPRAGAGGGRCRKAARHKMAQWSNANDR